MILIAKSATTAKEVKLVDILKSLKGEITSTKIGWSRGAFAHFATFALNSN